MRSIGQCVTLACLLEATAPKVGNVHRGADFADLTFIDFISSAVAIGPILENASSLGIGPTVLSAVKASRQATNSNAHLGTILLLAPLAAVPLSVPILAGIGPQLAKLNARDSECVYEAIRIANPGGLGDAAEMDVHGSAPDDLLAAMRLAEDRDLVAKQYVTEFEVVLTHATVWIVQAMEAGEVLTDAIVRTQLQLMATFPDSLIARKCGPAVADEAATRAQRVLDSAGEGDAAYHAALADFDFWLRSDNHRRNPGTTADIIAAALFVLLREDQLKPPFK